MRIREHKDAARPETFAPISRPLHPLGLDCLVRSMPSRLYHHSVPHLDGPEDVA